LKGLVLALNGSRHDLVEGGLTMAGISHAFTTSRIAEMLGEDEDLLQEISIDMNPEDGRLSVLGPGEGR
jgi:hypothetical protein